MGFSAVSNTGGNMAEILIVEANQRGADTIADHVSAHLGTSSIIAGSLEAAQKAVSAKQQEIAAVVLNIGLSPDNYVPFPKIPTIVVTNGVPTSGKQIAFAPHVLDYLPDSQGYHLEYIVQLIRRVLFSRNAGILVAAREKVTRTFVRKLLADKGYMVIEARSAKDALANLQAHPEICMVIVDGEMCEEKEFSLIKTIRKAFKKDRLSVLALCERSREYQRVMLLRCGANDCIDKPLRIEEFQARVMINLHLMEVLSELTELTNRDFLTRLYNRKYFFEIGATLFENYKRGALKLTMAMLDIDKMKDINDAYGHLTGDLVIKKTAKVLSENLRSADVIARIGGEEFCVLATDIQSDDAQMVFERVKKALGREVIPTTAGNLRFGVSIGVTNTLSESFEQMLHAADTLLYQAKGEGRNRVIFG